MLWRTLSLRNSFNCYIFWLYFSLKHPQSEHNVKIYTVSKWHGQNCMKNVPPFSSAHYYHLDYDLPLFLKWSLLSVSAISFLALKLHQRDTPCEPFSRIILILCWCSAVLFFFFFAQPLAQSLPHHKCSDMIPSFHISTSFFMSKFLNLILKMDSQSN